MTKEEVINLYLERLKSKQHYIGYTANINFILVSLHSIKNPTDEVKLFSCLDKNNIVSQIVYFDMFINDFVDSQHGKYDNCKKYVFDLTNEELYNLVMTTRRASLCSTFKDKVNNRVSKFGEKVIDRFNELELTNLMEL